MPHFPGYYHEKHSQHVEQVRSEIVNQMQSFQRDMLEELRRMTRNIEKTNSRISDVSMEVSYIRSQVDALVLHLLLPVFTLQKINEAIDELAKYCDVLDKRQSSLDGVKSSLNADIAPVMSRLAKMFPDRSPDTDSFPRVTVSTTEYEEKSGADEMKGNPA
jgi:chromosome segregation ATPase